MKRIFIAVDISDEARRAAAGYIEGLRRGDRRLRVGWERPEKLHLTLKFVGDVTDEQLDALRDAVQAAALQAAPFTLAVGRTGVFPGGRKARVLWLGIEDATGALARLSERVEAECEKRGFDREKRAFRPHLTIARLREPDISAELVGRHLQTNFEPIEFGVAEIVIYESRLDSKGSTYSAAAAYKLAG